MFLCVSSFQIVFDLAQSVYLLLRKRLVKYLGITIYATVNEPTASSRNINWLPRKLVVYANKRKVSLLPNNGATKVVGN